jgi:hypothetical protein
MRGGARALGGLHGLSSIAHLLYGRSCATDDGPQQEQRGKNQRQGVESRHEVASEGGCELN